MRVQAGCSAFVPTPAFAQIVHFFTMRHDVVGAVCLLLYSVLLMECLHADHT
jgi:hypothetical protein